jgi:hypothetical protein
VITHKLIVNGEVRVRSYTKGDIKPLVKKVLHLLPDANVELVTELYDCDWCLGHVVSRDDILADKIIGFC